MKGAIFDMDGLLLDTERLYQESWLEMAKQFGQTPDPAFPAAVSGSNGEGMRQIIRRYYPEVDAYAFQAGCIARVEGILDEQGPPVKPGARELLQFFRARGMKIAVASSTARERILTNLHAAELDGFFDAVVSGQQVERGKPEPDVFLLAAKEVDCAPEDCYVFEDSINGIRAGMAAGCVTVMVPGLVPPTEDILNSCTEIYPDLQAVQEAIEANIL